jgi:hypothetical protein
VCVCVRYLLNVRVCACWTRKIELLFACHVRQMCVDRSNCRKYTMTSLPTVSCITANCAQGASSDHKTRKDALDAQIFMHSAWRIQSQMDANQASRRPAPSSDMCPPPVRPAYVQRKRSSSLVDWSDHVDTMSTVSLCATEQNAKLASSRDRMTTAIGNGESCTSTFFSRTKPCTPV